MLRSAPCVRCGPLAAALQRGGSDDDPVSRLGDNLRHRPRGIEPMAVNSNIILPPFKTVDGQPINKVRISGTAKDRKSTRLNSGTNSQPVFRLPPEKKNIKKNTQTKQLKHKTHK